MSGLQQAILDGSLALALPIALAAGLLSFFTPCSLPLVPGYLSYVSAMAGAEERTTGAAPATAPPRRSRTVLGAVLFVAGFASVFTAYGLAFGSLGALLLEHQGTIWRVAGAITIVLGLLFAGGAERVPGLGRTLRPRFTPRLGLLGAPALGAVFGVGWTPCIGPALAAVLTLATTSATAGRGALLSFVYALGLGIPFVLAAISVSRATRAFGWVRRHSLWITRGGGLMLVLVGMLQVSGVWAELVAAVQTLVAGWQAPL